LIFHNVVTMSNALKRLVAEGYELDANLIACSSPYLTEHLNRYGRYALNRDRVPERSVSTIMRQVASEFSVDFPLSRWRVWVG